MLGSHVPVIREPSFTQLPVVSKTSVVHGLASNMSPISFKPNDGKTSKKRVTDFPKTKESTLVFNEPSQSHSLLLHESVAQSSGISKEVKSEIGAAFGAHHTSEQLSRSLFKQPPSLQPAPKGLPQMKAKSIIGEDVKSTSSLKPKVSQVQTRKEYRLRPAPLTLDDAYQVATKKKIKKHSTSSK